jgi:hypothetical protein
MPEDQILRPRRRTNRISLHKPHLPQGPIQCSWTREIPRDSVPPQVIEMHKATIAQR